MKDIIWKLPIYKATGLNKILNKIIKAVLEAVIIPLASAITIYLFKNKLPEYYKEIIIIILRKANKKDYSFLRSYRLVAFKNILGKLLEKIVIKYI